MERPARDTRKSSAEEYIVDIVEEDPCRICNSLDADLNILNDEIEDGVLLHEALEFITCLKVNSDDGMSQSLCASCNTRLLDAFRFKNQALDSYKSFYELGPQTVDIKIVAVEQDEVQLQSSLDDDETTNVETADTGALDEHDEENAKELEIDMSTDAVSFLIEHHSKNTMRSDPPTKSNTNSIKSNNTERNPGKYDCQVCGRKFRRRSNLVDHLRLHANVKKYVCTYCGKSFVQVANYRTHLRIHTKERPFQCPLCQKAYNQSGSLKIHMRSHTQERNYMCTCCDKKFTNSTDLRKHMRTHDCSQQFKCEYCEKSFAQRGNMKIHQRRHHLNVICD